MGNQEVEYTEMFERSGYDTIEQAKFKVAAVKEFYEQHPDWEVGEPDIIQDVNGKYTVKIPLTKYAAQKGGYSR